MKKSLRLASSVLLVLTLSASAYAWGNVGHMAVAFAAYKRLKPATRARADALVALNPKIDQWRALIPAGTSAADAKMMLFMIAATWPDQIKGDTAYHDDGSHGGNVPPNDPSAIRNTGYDDFARHKYWHFVDEPFSPDKTPTAPPPVPNALNQIDTFRKVLASDAPDALKSYDLVWLLHIVGDIHQPLHATARFIKTDTDGDDGGNGVSICNPTCPPPPARAPSLHSFWDDLPGTVRDIGPAVAPAIEYGKNLPATPPDINNLSACAWIDESFALAQSQVYRSPIGVGPGPFNITAAYRAQATELARQRVAQAGARLANVLNAELK